MKCEQDAEMRHRLQHGVTELELWRDRGGSGRQEFGGRTGMLPLAGHAAWLQFWRSQSHVDYPIFLPAFT